MICHRDCHRTGEYRPLLDGKGRGAGAQRTNITGQNGTRPDQAIRLNRDFKTGALNHSATLPSLEFQSLSVATDRTQCERGPNLDPRVPENGFRPA